MLTILARVFISEKQTKEEQRSTYGILCSTVGIFLNLLLFAGKFLAGWISGSIAITADAFNNLSDAGSSVVTLVGFRVAAHKPDRNHPYGHGRIEYLAGLGVAVIILIMAFELLQDSVRKIVSPVQMKFSAVSLGILAVSILVKCYMAYYNRTIGKKIGSAAIKAVAMDSLSDCIATLAVLITTLVSSRTGLALDGYGGVLVACFIAYAGITAARDTLNPLLGQAPDLEFVQQLENIVLHFDENISGVHDLMVHDYGPGRRFITLHAEVPAEGDILKLHDIIDNLEMKIAGEMNCFATIHMDPIVTKDAFVGRLKEQLLTIVKEIDPVISVHDFRVVKGETHTNLIFDVAVPFEFRMRDEEVRESIQAGVKQAMGEEFYTVIQVDKSVQYR